MMVDEPLYDEWIASRRAADPPVDLTERVMAAVAKRDLQRNQTLRLADRINESRLAQLAACLAAMLVGGFPFLIAAYVAHSLAF